MVLGVMNGDAEEDEEGSCANECRGEEGVGPQLHGALEGGRELQDEAPGRVCCTVVVHVGMVVFMVTVIMVVIMVVVIEIMVMSMVITVVSMMIMIMCPGYQWQEKHH